MQYFYYEQYSVGAVWYFSDYLLYNIVLNLLLLLKYPV